MILFLVKYYLEAKLFGCLPESYIKQIHIRRFRKIFEWAREHSEFYRQLYTEAGVMDLRIESFDDIKKVPIVDKGMMKRFDLESILTCSPSQPLAINRTSGSNGVPFAVYSSKREHFTGYVRSFMALKGYTPFKKFVLVGVFEEKEKLEKGSFLQIFQKYFGVFRREAYSVLTPAPVLIAKLQRKNISFLSSTPTCLQVLAEELKKSRNKLNISYIISSGETLNPEVKHELKMYFNAKVIDVYGCMELPSMAWTRPGSKTFRYALNTMLPEYIKCTNNPENLFGDLVFTNFINRTMPFIRYRVGDQLEKSEKYNRLGTIMGRADDILELTEGRKLHVVQLYVFSKINGIAQYKFYQNKGGEIYFYVVPEYGADLRKIREAVLKTWKTNIGDYSLEVEFKTDLPLNTRTGKFKRIEKEVI
ncbi:hypothetical protein [uncultured Draconibacterium sp.]|uniref:hypothetical protein n=1 Tax=uncultured Draconibacterium sp. TaxID=1573823 RepID=UPI0025E51E17|nr:hypothetical protein [uncultured Draconibacterium sp.]